MSKVTKKNTFKKRRQNVIRTDSEDDYTDKEQTTKKKTVVETTKKKKTSAVKNSSSKKYVDTSSDELNEEENDSEESEGESEQTEDADDAEETEEETRSEDESEHESDREFICDSTESETTGDSSADDDYEYKSNDDETAELLAEQEELMGYNNAVASKKRTSRPPIQTVVYHEKLKTRNVRRRYGYDEKDNPVYVSIPEDGERDSGYDRQKTTQNKLQQQTFTEMNDEKAGDVTKNNKSTNNKLPPTSKRSDIASDSSDDTIVNYYDYAGANRIETKNDANVVVAVGSDKNTENRRDESVGAINRLKKKRTAQEARDYGSASESDATKYLPKKIPAVVSKDRTREEKQSLQSRQKSTECDMQKNDEKNYELVSNKEYDDSGTSKERSASPIARTTPMTIIESESVNKSSDPITTTLSSQTLTPTTPVKSTDVTKNVNIVSKSTKPPIEAKRNMNSEEKERREIDLSIRENFQYPPQTPTKFPVTNVLQQTQFEQSSRHSPLIQSPNSDNDKNSTFNTASSISEKANAVKTLARLKEYEDNEYTER
ncbi:hypothetical protein EGW08_021963 [Elysia chlorotica]|uniref:Uncharacterized protein n=1 Tax=Elysia chlorotica TaxID=188477 RepID=A0A433SM96_ELYCH|nr:hypothetical protein EGW08_021963 [Elysia chlorotica]